jgi:predicted aspartyl protease
MTLDFLRPFFNLPPKFYFDPSAAAITIPVVLSNGSITINTTMALDTGATFVVIRSGLVEALNLIDKAKYTTSVASASGLKTVPRIALPQITALGLVEYDVQSLVVDLPESSRLDGLLGLSFLSKYNLEINFREGFLTLS